MEIHTLASNSKIACAINASTLVEKSLESYKQSCVCVRRGSEGESEEERKRANEKEKEVREGGRGERR